jgi:hypothetical protein
MSDTTRFSHVVDLVAPDFDKKFPSSKKNADLGMKMIMRFSVKCLEVYDMVVTKFPPPPFSERSSTKLKSNLRDRESRKILGRDFYFLEGPTDTVLLSLRDNLWSETHKGGIFSKLKLKWLGDSEFEIEFIESNHLVKKSLSNPGDKFRYTVLQKDADGYIICAEMFKDLRYQTFKIFIK